MATQPIQYDRLGVPIAAALGLVTSSYFELEARGIFPNPLAARSRLLAGVFSERAQEHISILAEPWAHALAFALALAVGVAVLRSETGSSPLLRFAYALATLALPIAAILLTLVAQPLARGELCAPCLLESLFALSILQSRSPARPRSDAVDASMQDSDGWRNRYSSPPSV